MRVARRKNERNLVWHRARITYASQMLPILRIIPVGGVFIAILALVLGLTSPGPSRARLVRVEPPAHGPLIEPAEHPEWRQFLILAAFQRADAIQQLRNLPDTPVRIATPDPVETVTAAPLTAPVPQEPAPVVAGLPVDQTEAAPDEDDTTGSITQTPAATIPVDIGESSSTELPVTKSEERPPVIRTPERAKPPGETRRKVRHRVVRHRAKATAKPASAQQPFDLFSPLFNQQYQYQQPAAANAAIAGPAPRRRSAPHQ